MYSLKGFMQASTAITRQAGEINVWGELSTQALTYAKSLKIYADNTSDIELVVFSSKTSTGKVDPILTFRTKVFEVFNKLMVLQLLPSTTITTREALLSHITNQYANSLTNINIGEMVMDSTGVYMPEWIGFSLVTTGSTTITENEVKIWFSDSSFLNQYDETEIVVVPPIGNLDDMFLPSNVLAPKLDEYYTNQLINKIQEAKGLLPESTIVENTFVRNNPSNVSIRLNTKWVVLLYGRLGNNIDAVKEAIKAYILANTTKTVAQWTAIFPDIYKNTLFFIYPRWKNFAIQERQLETGQYSTSTDPLRELKYVKKVLPTVPTDFIDSNLRLIPTNFKSVMLSIVGGTDNRNNLFSLDSIYPDILNVPTTDPLFDLMSTNTKGFIIALVKALEVAEKCGAYDNVPTTMSKVVISNVIYISFEYGNINYLVATKSSLPGY